MYQVDAFTNRVFGGNSAAVVALKSWLPTETMQSIALENNLSETAFFVPIEDGRFHIRWFTPEVEVDLCGHATLAAAHILFTELEPNVLTLNSIASADHYPLNKQTVCLRWIFRTACLRKIRMPT